MKKRWLKFTSVFLVLLITILGFSSCCNSNPTPTESVCILYGNTRNVPIPDYASIEPEITKMTEVATNCSMIVIDGNPNSYCYEETLYYPCTLPIFQKSNNAGYIKNAIKTMAQAGQAHADEIDILGALRSAEKKLSEDKDTKKKILIFSSGISTAGALNFADNPKLIEEDPNVIVNMLKASQSLPDLTNVEIVWHGFSVVEEPQKQLSDINEYRLETLWRAILTACNATIVSFESEVGAVSNYPIEEVKKDYPQVSVVEFPDVIDIDETKVQFKPRTAEFLDENKVYEELKPYAEMILQSGCKNFYLVGSTASVSGNAECLKLSTERAEAVKNVLCSFGVPASFLEIYGIGRENFGGEYKWRVNDLKADGKNLDEQLAQQNRKVMIIEKSSEKGMEFKQIWDTTMT